MVLSLNKEDYLQISKMCVLLITQLLRLVGRLCARKPVKPHQLGDCCYLTDRPKSVRSRCVIEVFGSVFMLSRCFVDFSVGVGAFVTGLIQIFPFSL